MRQNLTVFLFDIKTSTASGKTENLAEY